jgi:hypothetical protein
VPSIVQGAAGQFSVFQQAGGTDTVTASVDFDAYDGGVATTAGNTLVAICMGFALNESGYGYPGTPPIPVIDAPTTPGLTWQLPGASAGAALASGGGGFSSDVAIYFCPNAPSISTSTLTSLTVTTAGNVYVISALIYLLEIGGTNGVVDAVEENEGAASAVPSTANLSTTETDLILVASSSGAGNIAPGQEGPGYTLLADGNYAGVQYILNEAAGSIATAFGSGISYWPAWGCVAVAFQPSGGGGGGGGSTPILDVTPSTLSFSATYGGSNPASQNVSVSNGDGGTLSWNVTSDQSWLTPSPTSGTNSGAVAASVSISGLAVGTYTGHLTFSASGAADSPQTVTVTLTIASSGGGGSFTGFTPSYPPVKKQPFGLWGLEVKRADSITVDGIKQTVLERIDTVTTLTFPYIPLSDLPLWKMFEEYALTGGYFTYRPLLDYPNSTSNDPMFQYPGLQNGDNAAGFSIVQMVSMDWTPKFESQGIFSLALKLKLAQDVSQSFTVPGTTEPWLYNDPTYPFPPDPFSGGTAPISIAVSAGETFVLTYLSGIVNNGDGSSSDANGVPGLYGTSNAPMQYNGFPDVLDLTFCGGWANSSGDLIAPPFVIGDNATLTAPAGATQLLCGVNDYPWGDNSGSWTIGMGVN